ncbi:hypothetical protein BH24PSE2_BH24PSE2_23380 [soil metagenome]
MTGGRSELARAVRQRLGGHPHYIASVCRLYLDLYRMPLEGALRCVVRGYSSASAAMEAGIIRPRPASAPRGRFSAHPGGSSP